MKTITVRKKNKTLKGVVHLPNSKSISNRALIINFLSENGQELINLSGSDDTTLMAMLLKEILYKKGQKGLHTIHCDNAGTVLRFLTSVLAITDGEWVLTGNERMKLRPLKALIDALKSLGADIQYIEQNGFPPVRIRGKKLQGGKVNVDASISSQYISSLLLIAPALENGLTIVLIKNTSSTPYIQMTLNILKHFGIDSLQEDNRIYIGKQDFENKKLRIEKDWSAASFWFEMAALADEVDLQFPGLTSKNIQGDSIIVEIFKNFGVTSESAFSGLRISKKELKKRVTTINFINTPDLALPVIISFAGCGHAGHFSGLKNLRVKETDRLNALIREMKKCGFEAALAGNPEDPTLSLPEKKTVTKCPEPIETYADHRMAMAFAPLALIFEKIIVNNPEVVSKSYKNYWTDLKDLGFELS